jgi:hypothetical protein
MPLGHLPRSERLGRFNLPTLRADSVVRLRDADMATIGAIDPDDSIWIEGIPHQDAKSEGAEIGRTL